MSGRHPEDVERREAASPSDETSGDEAVDVLDSDDTADADVDADASGVDADGERSERVVDYWTALGIAPVEVALLRGGVGLTLREYRVIADEDAADDEDTEDAADTGDAEDGRDTGDGRDAGDAGRTGVDRDAGDDRDAGVDRDTGVAGDAGETEDAGVDRDADDPDKTDEIGDGHQDETDDRDEADEWDEEDEWSDEDDPYSHLVADDDKAVFLATDGTLHLFRDAETLVAFVQSGAEHDLASGPNWAELVRTLTPDLVVPDDEDRYELDLVVDNLRGGRDVWERDLIVGAGEFARDVAYALGLTEVQAMLRPDSPLDDLDEALRAKGFFGRRKLKKIGVDQAALAWRSVIGRISSSVEWHD